MDKYALMAGMLPSKEKISPVASCQGGIFVPVQQSAEMWDPPTALLTGTAFPCLYSPWEKGENFDG